MSETTESSAWHEADFEGWFDKHPVLPSGERVVLVGRHQPIRRMVDLIAIDSTGGLVILEVKNETSNRRAIGQALEYLSQYDETSLDAVLEDEDGSGFDRFRAGFLEAFKAEPPELNSRRRVFLVAPSHDSYSSVCTRYLSTHLSGGEISFHLLTARRAGDGFDLQEFDSPPFQRSSTLARGFALSPRGRLFYILEPGALPIVWSIGRWRDGVLDFRAKPAPRGIRPLKWHLLPIDPPGQIDLAQLGTTWTERDRPSRQAKLIAVVTQGSPGTPSRSIVAFAAFRDGQFRTVRRRPVAEFFDRWVPAELTLPDWRTVVEQAQELATTRKARAAMRERA